MRARGVPIPHLIMSIRLPPSKFSYAQGERIEYSIYWVSSISYVLDWLGTNQLYNSTYQQRMLVSKYFIVSILVEKGVSTDTYILDRGDI